MTLEELKEIADKLNVKFHHLIGAEKLEAQLREHCQQTLNKPFEEVVTELGYTITNTPSDEQQKGYSPSNDIQDESIKALSKMTFAKADAKIRKKSDNNTYKDAMKLVRCIITCNNKNKSSFQGEIFSARNASIEEVKKFIPFGVPTHVPVILLNMIKEKQYQMFRKERLPNGNTVTRPFLVAEYNIQELPPLTAEEFNAIKRKQLAEGENSNG